MRNGGEGSERADWGARLCACLTSSPSGQTVPCGRGPGVCHGRGGYPGWAGPCAGVEASAMPRCSEPPSPILVSEVAGARFPPRPSTRPPGRHGPPRTHARGRFVPCLAWPTSALARPQGVAARAGRKEGPWRRLKRTSSSKQEQQGRLGQAREPSRRARSSWRRNARSLWKPTLW